MAIPDNWTNQPTQTLDCGSDEAREIISRLGESLLTEGLGTFVTNVERIQNRELYKKYQLRKATMEEQNKSQDIEQSLWHGTSVDAIYNVCKTGYPGPFFGKHETETELGHEFYFSKDADFAHANCKSDEHMKQHIYLAKVLTGTYTTGSEELTESPL